MMDVIGGYRLLRRIGRGGMAEVWVAQRQGQQNAKFVAVKLIAQHHAGDERYTRMFRAEAELSALLTHSNIVQVFDAGEDMGRSYLVMEWIDGPSLAKLQPTIWGLQGVDDELRLRLVAYITGQLLHALSYAHKITSSSGDSLGIVHRDVSPHNVLISISGDVKLTDFGIAHRVTEETSGLHVKGKLRYMPREQVGGQSRAPTVDLYAVGAIFHELLDGQKFRGNAEDEAQLYGEALSGKIPPLRFPVPPELEALRLGLLQSDPKRRIQSADLALAHLKRWSGYGDMRLELGRLCGAMTGTLHPRTGPALGAMAALLRQPAEPAPHLVARRDGPPLDLASSHPGIDAFGATMVAPPGSTVPAGPLPLELEAPVPKGQTVAIAGRPAGFDPLGSASSDGFEPTASTATSRRYRHGYEDSGLGEGTVGTAATQGTWTRGNWRRRAGLGLLGIAGVVGLGAGAGLLVIEANNRNAPGVQMAAADELPKPAPAAAEPAAAEPAAAEPAPPAPVQAATEPPPTQPVAAQPALPAAEVAAPQPAATPPNSVPSARPEPEAKPEAKPEPKRSRSRSRTRTKTPTSAPAPKPSADGPPVMVHFRLDGLEEAQVRLNRRTFSVQPRHSAKLPSGSYHLMWRRSADERWKNHGQVSLGANGEWVVKIKTSGPEIINLK